VFVLVRLIPFQRPRKSHHHGSVGYTSQLYAGQPPAPEPPPAAAAPPEPAALAAFATDAAAPQRHALPRPTGRPGPGPGVQRAAYEHQGQALQQKEDALAQEDQEALRIGLVLALVQG